MTGLTLQPFEHLAVVGMDVAFPDCDGLDDFEQVIYNACGPQKERSGSAGFSVGDALLEKVAGRSLRDAGVEPFAAKSPRIGVLAAGNRPLDCPVEGASRFRCLSGEANPLLSALAQAQAWFAGDEVDVVLFAAVSGLPGVPEGEVFAPPSVTGMGFERSVHGWRSGDGAGSVVWMRADRAVLEGRRIYAVIRSCASSRPPAAASPDSVLPIPPGLDEVRNCCQAAQRAAGVTPDQVGYIEAFASGNDTLDGVEIAGLARSYRQPAADLTTAVGSAQANAGYLGAASGLVGMIRAALCLYHRMIPAVPDWSAPKLPALWRGSPFYMPVESRAWFIPAGKDRIAGLNAFGLDGSFAHLILSEGGREEFHPNRALERGGFHLIPIAASDIASLLNQLDELRRALADATDLPLLAARAYEEAENRYDLPYAAVIVGHTHEELAGEVDLALRSIPQAFEHDSDWQTPLGSVFTPQPVGRSGEIALVYPGAFNSYPLVARDLFRLFPWLHQKVIGRTRDLGRVMRERQLYPRSLAAPSKEEQAEHESRLINDPIAMLTSVTTIAILFSEILREGFKVPVTSAFGYSLGENSMMFASGIWQEGDAVTGRLEASPVFQNRLAGPQNAIREYWGLEPLREPDPQRPLWNNFIVMAPYERVAERLIHEPRVYVTHINTPRQVVIGGDPEACRRVIKALRCSSLQAPFDFALHCQPMASEIDELAWLHDWPVAQPSSMRLYSAAGYEPIGNDRREISQKIARMLTSPLDFPRLVRRVYDDGVRVFIEAGAGSNCARWIDESLKGSPHLALSINRRGMDDYTALVRFLARLYSHRVPADLSPLYQTSYEKVSQ